MRKLIIGTLIFGLIGCASSNDKKNDDEWSEASNDFHEAAAKTKPNADRGSSDSKLNEGGSRGAQNSNASNQKSESSALDSSIQEGNDDSITRAAQAVLGKNSNDVQALNALGVVHYRKGHWAGANFMFDRVLKIDPRNVQAHNNKGLVALAKKENREAILEFRKALEIDPSSGVASANIGSLYLQNGDYNKAYIALEVAHKKLFRDPKVLNNYAIAAAAVGKGKEAQDAYLKAMDKSPGNKDIMYNYSILLIDELKMYKEGLDMISKIKFMGHSPEVKERINTLENTAKAGLK